MEKLSSSGPKNEGRTLSHANKNEQIHGQEVEGIGDDSS